MCFESTAPRLGQRPDGCSSRRSGSHMLRHTPSSRENDFRFVAGQARLRIIDRRCGCQSRRQSADSELPLKIAASPWRSLQGQRQLTRRRSSRSCSRRTRRCRRPERRTPGSRQRDLPEPPGRNTQRRGARRAAPAFQGVVAPAAAPGVSVDLGERGARQRVGRVGDRPRDPGARRPPRSRRHPRDLRRLDGGHGTRQAMVMSTYPPSVIASAHA